MITQIIQLLNQSYYYNSSDLVEIAKGKYKLPENIKEIKNLIIRRLKYKK
jgi:hypothetical protein